MTGSATEHTLPTLWLLCPLPGAIPDLHHCSSVRMVWSLLSKNSQPWPI